MKGRPRVQFILVGKKHLNYYFSHYLGLNIHHDYEIEDIIYMLKHGC